ncbi:MAG: hypothetical protein KGO96_03480 [Elusimicrobia bacterium]|nr:hypothetical protein [Elusimicrobiota bacterium]MDE2424954.1 hypothetical protein [Elusimicrobiota bacterium]
MSLKHFHVFFISCSAGLMTFLEFWTREQSAAGQAWPRLSLVAAVGLVASFFYLLWFLRRYRWLR